MNRFWYFVPTAIIWLWLPPGNAADPAGKPVVDFERDIRPLLNRHCLQCHGPDDQNGGLRFDQRATVFAEANSGSVAIVPGDVDSSELLVRITSADQDLQMPPEGDRLTEAEVRLLKAWVAAGAIWPKHSDADSADPAKPAHWAFQPITDPVPPAVTDSGWPINDLDRFIQARREAAGLTAAADADAATLIRRVSYGLTGLPPSPGQVQALVAAAASQQTQNTAYAELVEELLARPEYGERWGRHWMDWVRYADTAGDNSDFPIPQAWLYRNYIIDAFNQDLPYDRFLTEQIAGDLLPADSQEQKNRQTIATGYLAMSRRFGSLVERYPWHLTIEDTIDNLGRTTMGLTIACARCHDHKFDPISARDYYGLYGIFASTRYPFPGIELFQTQMDLVPLIPDAEVAKTTQPFQAETEKLSAELERLLEACQQRAIENAAREAAASVAEQRKMQDELDSMLIKARRVGESLADHLKKVPPIPVAYAVQEAEPLNAVVQIKGEPTRPGAEVPRKFPDVLGGFTLPDGVAASGSGRLQLAGWIASPQNPLTARVIVNRIWQRHFGEGLVPTTSDFGLRGEPPTHPELLDWLASEFMRSGWSIKQLHRLILTSRTYRLSSQDVEANLASDPGNRLHWKFNRQRLDAESIRDTLLLVSGRLDRTPQTEPYPIPPYSKWEYTQHHPFKDQYDSNKRSVYLMTKRLTAQPYFQTFDGPDPNVCTSGRDQSVTPIQALYFVNDEFVHQRATEFADVLLQETGGDSERARKAFSTILCRMPNPDETALLENYLASAEQQLNSQDDSRRKVWSSLVRSLFRLNEFLYVD